MYEKIIYQERKEGLKEFFTRIGIAVFDLQGKNIINNVEISIYTTGSIAYISYNKKG